MSQRADYKVHGLDCSEEVAILQREVGRRDGVGNLSFDVVNGRMSVEFDPEVVTSDVIVSAVNATGMKAVPWAQRNAVTPESFWSRHGRLILTALSGGFLATGFVTHGFIHGSMMDALTGGHEPSHAYPLISILLYVASVATGAWFVAPKAIQSARRLQPDMNLLMVIAVIGALLIGEWFEAATVAFLFALSLTLES